MAFGLCLGKKPDASVIILHRNKSPEILMRMAKKAGETPKVTCGKIETKGKKIKLDCAAAVPPGLAKNLRRYLLTLGLKGMSVTVLDSTGSVLEEELDEEEQAAVDEQAELEEKAEEQAPDTDGTIAKDGSEADPAAEELSEPGARPPTDADASEDVATGSDDEDAFPEDPNNPDDDDDIAAANGDLGALLRAVRKKTHNFAWLNSPDGMVLKAHKRKPVNLLLRQAKAEGGQPRGGWGQMDMEGTSLILTCTEDPPGAFAKNAKAHLNQQGQKCRIILRTPLGEVVEEDGTGEQAATTGGESEEPAISAELREEVRQLTEPLAKAKQSSDPAVAGMFRKLVDALKHSLTTGNAHRTEQILALIRSKLPLPNQQTEGADEAGADDMIVFTILPKKTQSVANQGASL